MRLVTSIQVLSLVWVGAACGAAQSTGTEDASSTNLGDAGLNDGDASTSTSAHDGGAPMDAGPTAHDGGALEDAGVHDFIARQGDFIGYTNWLSFDGGTEASDGLNTTAQRTLYVNQVPPHGSTKFPKGSIIVKDTADAVTFAMVKRGDDYNRPFGWEWFQLAPGANGIPIIVWRGTVPPMGAYGGIKSCNDCHGLAKSNDYVGGVSLELASF